MSNENMHKNEIHMLSLNIERDNHLETVESLIHERKPGVLCLQEIQLPFAEYIAKKIGYEYRFSLRQYHPPKIAGAEKISEGIFMAWHPSLDLVDTQVHVYNNRKNHTYPGDENDARRSLLVATLKHGSEVFRFGVSHFTWTPDGSASDEQREDMHRMLSSLEEYKDDHGIVFCGDFNAPRGGEIFSMMSSRYSDNLPPHIVTTLDQKLHRAAPLQHAVDSIFSTKEYRVLGVEVVGGVSDHMALIASVSRNVP